MGSPVGYSGMAAGVTVTEPEARKTPGMSY